MMHRSYQPILPCGNKFLQQRWDKTNYDEHQRKVQAAKPMVDASAPPTYGHLNLKLKKLKLEQERLSVIERDNRLLMEKMSCIMRTKGGVDNRNNYEMKSLNRQKREKELLRVSKENLAILDRIEKCEPQYRVQTWAEDYQRAEQYMDSIAKYPRGWYSVQHEKPRSKGSKRTGEESIKGRQKKEDSDRSDIQKTKAEENGPKKGKQAKAEAAEGQKEEAKRNDPKKDKQSKVGKVQGKMVKGNKNSKNEKEKSRTKDSKKAENVKAEKSQQSNEIHEKIESDVEEENEIQNDHETKEELAESEAGESENVSEVEQESTAENAQSKSEEVEEKTLTGHD